MRITFKDNETDEEYDEWASYYNGTLAPKYVPREGDSVRVKGGHIVEVVSVFWLNQEEVICYVER